MTNKKFHFTIDVDFLYGAESGVLSLFALCNKLNLRPTFFYSGYFALHFGELIAEGERLGFEAGTHGLTHGPFENFATAPYEKQLKWISTATNMISKFTLTRPRCFRAPNLWISEATLKALKQENYFLDSSVPARRFDFGLGRISHNAYFLAPQEPYHPSPINLGVIGNSTLTEVPPSALFAPLNMTTLRILGINVLKYLTRLLMIHNKTIVFYVHPQELVSLEMLKFPYSSPPQRHLRNIGPQYLPVLEQFICFVLSFGYKSYPISTSIL